MSRFTQSLSKEASCRVCKHNVRSDETFCLQCSANVPSESLAGYALTISVGLAGIWVPLHLFLYWIWDIDLFGAFDCWYFGIAAVAIPALIVTIYLEDVTIRGCLGDAGALRAKVEKKIQQHPPKKQHDSTILSEQKKHEELSFYRRLDAGTTSGLTRVEKPSGQKEKHDTALAKQSTPKKTSPASGSMGEIDYDDKVRTTEAKKLHFQYVDALGKVSTRQIVNWTTDRNYIHGFCLDRLEVRSFRKDRVIDYLDGFQPTWTVETRRETKQKPEILFTGFSAMQREDLEQQAKLAGLLVKKTITSDLAYICFVGKRSSEKVAKACLQGAIALNLEQFKLLIETGELPSA